MAPLVRRANGVADFTLNQLLRIPHDPLAAVLFGLRTLEQGSPAWNTRFRDELAPALLTGVAAHSVGALPSLAPAGAGLMLGTLAHAQGWPIPVGGSASIARCHGPGHRSPRRDRGNRAADRFPGGTAGGQGDTPGYCAAGTAQARRGQPARRVPPLAGVVSASGTRPARSISSCPDRCRGQAAELADAGTVHVGGTRAEMADAENQVAAGKHPERPYVLVSQPSRFDDSRAPKGRHILWTYCHVPAGFNGGYGGGCYGPAGTVCPWFP